MEIRNCYGELDNVCNTPKIATIEIHHNSYGTGEYFVHFIEHTDSYASGYWQDRQISKEEYETLMAFCAPTFTEEEKEKDDDDYVYYMVIQHLANHQKPPLSREQFDEINKEIKAIAKSEKEKK